jgi:hypothetical protein
MAIQVQPYHPLMFADPRTWRRLLRLHGPLDPASRQTQRFIRVGTTIESLARTLERRRVAAWQRRNPPENAPIIIVGHWRSGTTMLHNHLHATGAFAVLRHVDAIRPWAANPRDGWLARRLHSGHRGLDEMPLNAESPQEDEIALAAMTPLSSFHFTSFPRDIGAIFRRSVLLEDVSPADLDHLEFCLRFVLARIRRQQTAPLPILLKNPAHTARIDFLRHRFPQARFIHIVRHPVHVQLSNLRFVDFLMRPLSLQGPPGTEFADSISSRYRSMMLAHLQQRRSLPAGSYHEIRYEDHILDPEAHIRRIFDFLGLPLLSAHLEGLRTHLAQSAGYRGNRHPEDESLRDQFTRESGFALDQWNYR